LVGALAGDPDFEDLCHRCGVEGPPVVTAVMHFKNGMVMVFDQRGEQITGLQGRYEEVRARLAAIYPEDKWERWDYATGRRW
jgi:hypothetical protein